MKFKKILIIGSTALMLTPLVTSIFPRSRVQASENDTNSIKVYNNQEDTQEITFTNTEFFESGRSLGYDVEEPIDDPNYNPNEVNTIIVDTSANALSKDMVFSTNNSTILDRQVVTISQSVVNSVKNVGATAGAAILALYVPGGFAAAGTIAAAIVNEVDINRDLQITMIRQQTGATPRESRWFVIDYSWV